MINYNFFKGSVRMSAWNHLKCFGIGFLIYFCVAFSETWNFVKCRTATAACNAGFFSSFL
jgi:hypothetical protein